MANGTKVSVYTWMTDGVWEKKYLYSMPLSPPLTNDSPDWWGNATSFSVTSTAIFWTCHSMWKCHCCLLIYFTSWQTLRFISTFWHSLPIQQTYFQDLFFPESFFSFLCVKGMYWLCGIPVASCKWCMNWKIFALYSVGIQKVLCSHCCAMLFSIYTDTEDSSHIHSDKSFKSIYRWIWWMEDMYRFSSILYPPYCGFQAPQNNISGLVTLPP